MLKRISILFSLILGVVSVAYAASSTLSGAGPTMTMRGREYIQNLTFSNPGAQRTIGTVSWNQSFNTGSMPSPDLLNPGTVPNPQPGDMIVHLCLAIGPLRCQRIDGRTSGSTSLFAGTKWTDYAPFSFHWEPQGSGSLTPTAYGKTNSVTVNYN